MKIGLNIRLKTILFIFSVFHFFSYGHFYDPLIFYFFGLLDSVYRPSSVEAPSAKLVKIAKLDVEYTKLDKNITQLPTG